MPDPKLSGNGGLTFQAGPGPKSNSSSSGTRASGSAPTRRSSRPPTRRATTCWATASGPGASTEAGEVSVAARSGGRRLIARRGARAVAGRRGGRRGRGRRAGCCSRPATTSHTGAANDAVPLGAAAVERRDLVAREDVDGTLGFADTTKATAPAAGTITRLRDEGDTVTRGRSLMSIDAKATAWVLYGTIPMYRDLGPGVADGSRRPPARAQPEGARLRPRHRRRRLDLGDDRRGGRLPGRSRPHPERDDRRARRSSSATARRASASTAPRSATPARAGAPVTELTSTTPVDHREARRRAGRRRARRRRREGDPARRQRGRRQGDRASAPSPPPARTAPRRRSSCAWP